MVLPANARLSLTVTLNEGPISGYPIQRRLEDQTVTLWATIREGDGDGVLTYTNAPFVAGTVRELLLTADYPVRVALNGQDQDGTTDLALQSDGLVLLFKTSMANAGPVVIANPTDVASYLHGLAVVET